MQNNSTEREVWSHLSSAQPKWGSGTAAPQGSQSLVLYFTIQKYAEYHNCGHHAEQSSLSSAIAPNSLAEPYKHHLEKKGWIWEVELAEILNHVVTAVLHSVLLYPHSASQLSVYYCIAQSTHPPRAPKMFASQDLFEFFATDNLCGGELQFNSGSKLIWVWFKCWKIFGANLFFSFLSRQLLVRPKKSSN